MISLRALRVTLTALLIASVIAMPLGRYLAVQRFAYRRLVIAIINALMGCRRSWWGWLSMYCCRALARSGCAIGEVGAIMIVGGNIDHVTRVLTTAIALETGKGDFALALGLGFVLIGLAILVNIAILGLWRTERAGRW